MKTPQLDLFDVAASPKPKKEAKPATAASIAIAEKPNAELPPIALPSTKFDIIEQFALALQNRDAIGMKQMLVEKLDDFDLRTADEFISKFIGYCNKMEKKYKGIYVQTVPGFCSRYNRSCDFGKHGLGVTVSAINRNKLLWRFNIVFRDLNNGLSLNMRRCGYFVVHSEEVPY
jgi:hypothetical protein